MARSKWGAQVWQVLLAVVVALIGLKVFEMRNSIMMMHTSARIRLPGFYIRQQASGMGPVRCRNVHGAYEEDSRAHSVDPKTNKPAQTTESCEDVRMSTWLGIAVFSCDPGRVKWNAVMGPLDEPHKRGAIWILDYKVADAQPYYLQIDQFPNTYDFHPLGLSLLDLSPTLARLFVVNHRGVGNTVEVIDMQKQAGKWKARYVRSISDVIGTHAANSIQALDRNELLVTNMHTAQKRTPPQPFVERTVENLYGTTINRYSDYFGDSRHKDNIRAMENVVGGGWVAHIKFGDQAPKPKGQLLERYEHDVKAHAIAKRIPFANGIATTPGLRHVVVASTSTPGVLIFPVTRWTEDGEPDWNRDDVLGQRIVVPTPFFADNLEVVPPKPVQKVLPDDPLFGAKIIVAGHPSLPDMAEMMQNFGSDQLRGPSWAVEIQYTGQTAIPDDAPFPADRRLAGLPRGWSVRTLMQTDGRPAQYDGNTVELPTSCGVAWDNHGEGLGTIIFSGLYSPAPLVCQGVYA
ncbi:hypothetical protein MYAM1_003899 [Malassezia yamatoensis]|uniref:Uncharacterized protein n=1 Tax=Malassezia yamatoensis TaxID=253288 RepID=A0AAJ5Z0T6_9BASI|nr:hypothetical protein MYAM1_003899 [Malassezia yamatoensis]